MQPLDKTENPAYWLLLFLEALQGLRGGNDTPATKYLQFVEKHRGRTEALGAMGRLRKYKKTGIFPKAQQKINELRKVFNE